MCACGKLQPEPEGNLIDFIRESNLIEGVEDVDSIMQALEAWEYLMGEKELTIGVVLKAHKILMLHQKIYGYERGYFRQRDVSVGYWKIVGIDPVGGMLTKQFVKTGNPIPHKDIKGAMDQWIYIANQIKTADYPDLWAKQSHIGFEHIHPFIDGNGRLGRLLLNWQRVKMKLPILVIKNAEKKEYYEWFKI